MPGPPQATRLRLRLRPRPRRMIPWPADRPVLSSVVVTRPAPVNQTVPPADQVVPPAVPAVPPAGRVVPPAGRPVPWHWLARAAARRSLMLQPSPFPCQDPQSIPAVAPGFAGQPPGRRHTDPRRAGHALCLPRPKLPGLQRWRQRMPMTKPAPPAVPPAAGRSTRRRCPGPWPFRPRHHQRFPERMTPPRIQPDRGPPPGLFRLRARRRCRCPAGDRASHSSPAVRSGKATASADNRTGSSSRRGAATEEAT